MKPEPRPQAGDEVEYAPHCRAVLTDLRHEVPILYGPGGLERVAADPEGLRVIRTRAERIAAGEL
ncbi:hypothetical protein [Streptomyces sp. NPDC002855]|uniref:hypothetical protein n=1 Tax=Streptomyces sp. NPDC002855 TaxID=3154437 RepID=UPI00331D85CD